MVKMTWEWHNYASSGYYMCSAPRRFSETFSTRMAHYLHSNFWYYNWQSSDVRNAGCTTSCAISIFNIALIFGKL